MSILWTVFLCCVKYLAKPNFLSQRLHSNVLPNKCVDTCCDIRCLKIALINELLSNDWFKKRIIRVWKMKKLLNIRKHIIVFVDSRHIISILQTMSNLLDSYFLSGMSRQMGPHICATLRPDIKTGPFTWEILRRVDRPLMNFDHQSDQSHVNKRSWSIPWTILCSIKDSFDLNSSSNIYCTQKTYSSDVWSHDSQRNWIENSLAQVFWILIHGLKVGTDIQEDSVVKFLIDFKDIKLRMFLSK